MAYFSNATEFGIWQQDNCEKCLHDLKKCPILAIHSTFNEPKRDTEIWWILQKFIPTNELDGYPAQCAMFIASNNNTNRLHGAGYLHKHIKARRAPRNSVLTDKGTVFEKKQSDKKAPAENKMCCRDARVVCDGCLACCG